uniref:MIT domain-containing protein n=1 Tax=Oryzias latipes TaxID=8090 RepID=A0A3P9M679_ORYLA
MANDSMKAIAVAQKASEEDQAGNYEEAIRSYQHAVKYFLHILKREPQGKDGNQKIRDKCKLYLDRVEELQEYMANKEVTTNYIWSLRSYSQHVMYGDLALSPQ